MSNSILGDLQATVHYYGHEIWLESSHPYISSLPLVGGGPWFVIAFVLLYNVIIRKIGPLLMKGREPFNLRRVMITHNALLVLVNLYVVGRSLPYAHLAVQCSNINILEPKELESIIQVFYFYYISKYVDLADTVFFLLRKKWRNISTLHLFHHSVMPIGSYFFLKYATHTSAGFLPFVNSIVHIVMYSYYMITAYDKNAGSSWKKYITQMQLIQFAMYILQSFYFLFVGHCQRPKIYHSIEMVHAILFMYMFGSFYAKNYLSLNVVTKKGATHQELNNNVQVVEKKRKKEKGM